jgi:hypothetical protein
MGSQRKVNPRLSLKQFLIIIAAIVVIAVALFLIIYYTGNSTQVNYLIYSVPWFIHDKVVPSFAEFSNANRVVFHSEMNYARVELHRCDCAIPKEQYNDYMIIYTKMIFIAHFCNCTYLQFLCCARNVYSKKKKKTLQRLSVTSLNTFSILFSNFVSLYFYYIHLKFTTFSSPELQVTCVCLSSEPLG